MYLKAEKYINLKNGPWYWAFNILWKRHWWNKWKYFEKDGEAKEYTDWDLYDLINSIDGFGNIWKSKK